MKEGDFVVFKEHNPLFLMRPYKILPSIYDSYDIGCIELYRPDGTIYFAHHLSESNKSEFILLEMWETCEV